MIGNATLNIDRYFRMLGVRRAAMSSVAALPNDSIAIMQAYCDGINDYLATSPPLSLEFLILGVRRDQIRPFTPVDVVQWTKVMAYDMGANLEPELRAYQLHHARNLTWERIKEFYPDDRVAYPTVTTDDLLNYELVVICTNRFCDTDHQRGRTVRESRNRLRDDASTRRKEKHRVRNNKFVVCSSQLTSK